MSLFADALRGTPTHHPLSILSSREATCAPSLFRFCANFVPFGGVSIARIGTSDAGRSPRNRPASFPCRTVYGRATPPRLRVVNRTPAIAAASSAAIAAPAPKDVQSKSLPFEVAVASTEPAVPG
jgi:hypothetical protein